MKKKFTIGLIALLSVSFIFFGCGDSGGGGPSSQQTDLEKAALELADTLLEAGIPVDTTKALEGIITLTGDDEITVEAAITIGDGLTLVVPAEKTLIVGEDVTVDGGTIQVAAGGSLVGPAIDPATGGPADKAIIFENGGKVEIAQGAALSTPISSGGAVKFVDPDPDDTDAVYKWGSGDDGVITLKAGNVTELTSGKLEVQNDTAIAESSTVVIAPNAELTIPADKAYTVEGDLEVNGTVKVATGGTLVGPALGEEGQPGTKAISFGTNGKVEVEQGAALFAGDTEFVSDEASALYKWTGASGGVITLKAGEVTELTSGNLEVQKDTAIAPTSTVVIASGAELTVPTGKAYAVLGDLEVNGTVKVADGGTLFGPALGTEGEPGTKAISFGTNGSVEVAQGAALFAGTTEFVGSGNDAHYAWTGASGGVITLKAGNVTELTSGKLEVKNDTGIAESSKVVIADEAELVVNAAYLIDGNLEVSGTFTLGATASGTNNGTITVKNGGVSTSESGALGGAARTVVEPGGKVYFWGGAAPVLIVGGENDTTAAFQLTTGTLTTTAATEGNPSSYVVDGTARVNGIMGGYDVYPSKGYYLIGAGTQVTVKADSELTVAATAILYLRAEDAQLLVGEPNAAIVFLDGAILWGPDPEEFELEFNFYDSDGTALDPEYDGDLGKHVYPLAEDADTIFAWDADAGGEGIAGWKKVAEEE